MVDKLTKILLLLCLIGSIFCDPPDACLPPPEVGPCRAAMTKFYYDVATESCKTFIYGGCSGGPNRFSTLEECEKTCKTESDDFCDPGTE